LSRAVGFLEQLDGGGQFGQGGGIGDQCIRQMLGRPPVGSARDFPSSVPKFF